MIRKIITYICLVLFPIGLFAQASSKMSRDEYIEAYKDLAIKEMMRSGVPASITLAQGMLESDNGNSRLAVKGNNHFGIKCHSDWKGKRIYHDDDRKNECFRKYKSVYESYADHSDFLMDGSRYAFLFELDPADYKGWARGLKKAGYATSRKYADLLIKIIEENDLHKFDLMKPGFESESDKVLRRTKLSGRPRLINNRIDYIIVQEGDSFESLSRELKLRRNPLYRYNELTADSLLQTGQVLYLQPKRNKAEAGKKVHILREGESMYYVSQLYGIKLDKLLLRNGLKPGDKPDPGTEILLRGGKKILISPSWDEEPEPEDSLRFEFDE